MTGPGTLRRAAQRATFVVSLLAATACRHAPEVQLPLHTARGERPNIMLIVIDTLRVDHVGAYGYPVPTTPVIDRLASRGVRFTQVVSAAPETAPAMASMLTGNYQYRHRCYFNQGRLPTNVTTISEILHGAGYTTAAVVGNTLIDTRAGFNQGFDVFEEFGRIGGFTNDPTGVDRAIAWLRTAPRQPWFLWVHLIDPHGPYLSADASVSAALQYPAGTNADDTIVPVSDKNFVIGMIPAYQHIEGLQRLNEYVRRYDGEIVETDTQVGRLLDAAEAAGLMSDTLVVLTADHGESLTEHREYFQHGWFLHDQTLHVPLVVSWPGVVPQGTTVDTQVSSVDLTPTLLEMIGAGGDEAAQLDGRSFARLVFGATAEARPAFAVGPRENHQFCVRDGGWKLILTPAGRPTAPAASPETSVTKQDQFELYDLGSDPAETTDVAASQPDRTARLKATLTHFRDTFHMGGVSW